MFLREGLSVSVATRFLKMAAVLSVCTLAASSAAHAEDAGRGALQHRNFAMIRALLDESDIPTDGPQTILSHSVETPCPLMVQQIPGSEGGTALTISIDVRRLDLSKVVPGVQMQAGQGTEHKSHVLFVEHGKTPGVTVEATEYCADKVDSLRRCRTHWNAPHVGISPRRALGKLHDRALSDEADRENVQRLHAAFLALAASCQN